ncbi:hypothetical protein [Salinimicrobium sediminilitoris]|uniref:hypothetical protein n=1 Tax=Salinimicrobium sediminilitoris TaxID=2876715 RepID=UPI001E5E9924|nr:hypothetical protein [Salinimicrobium sediminilitoris]MCC8360154.1 hypothetical protein [Salinimicrobium sediminilitoris]
MEPENLKAHLDEIIHNYNRKASPDFEGLSPEQMYCLVNDPFSVESPLKLRTLDPEDFARIPILNQIKYLIAHLKENDELKLTKKGFLPVKLVADLYNQGYIKDVHIEEGISKLYKETDAGVIHLSRLLLELSGMTKKRNGKLSLTKAGGKIAANDQELLELIFKTMCLKFNWSYFDGYEDENVGQLGFGFSLLLLSKYGQQSRPAAFYLEKYLQAFPQLLERIEPGYRSPQEYALAMYSIRSFDRFLLYFNFISKSGGEFDPAKHLEIKTTGLYEKFVGF